jgi:WS/DGAT/MGAT family acyltransferase
MIRSRITRASSTDMMELASDVGPTPRQMGAVLFLAAGDTLGLDAVRGTLGRRIGGIRRMRQRLMRAPWGCGRPVWVDDPGFDIAHHVRSVPCPPPGDRAAVLTAAIELLGRRLPPQRPLWEVTLLDGVADGGALVVVLHHVLADGMSGLALLERMVDGGPTPPLPDSTRGAVPSTAELAWDAARSRLRALGHIRALPGKVRAAAAELRSGSAPRAARCSLNRPVGPHRTMIGATYGLEAVRKAARTNHATVNDVMVTVVAGAFDTLLAHRGEHVDPVVVSVPVSGRPRAAAAALGNQVGVMPVAAPTGVSPQARLVAVAAATRNRRSRERGASAALLAPVFRALAAVHLMRWVVNHQPVVHTFATSLRGPDMPVSFLGATVRDIVPLNVLTGNVAVDFAALSYAGSITITATADPDVAADLDILADAFARQLDELCGH